jgi:hypothetical protein
MDSNFLFHIVIVFCLTALLTIAVGQKKRHENVRHDVWSASLTCEPHTDEFLEAIEAPRKCELIFSRRGSPDDPTKGAQ